MKTLALLLVLLGLSACVSVASPDVPAHGVAFAGLSLQFET